MEFDSWKEAGFVKCTDVENAWDAAGVPKKVLSLDLLQSWRVDIWVRTADWALAFLGCWVVGRSTREEVIEQVSKSDESMRRKLTMKEFNHSEIAVICVLGSFSSRH